VQQFLNTGVRDISVTAANALALEPSNLDLKTCHLKGVQ